MSNAKKCDNCGELFEPSTEANDPHQVNVRQRGDWSHPAIGARISLYNEREHDLIDDCRKCTVLAVRKFMAKFGITEQRGIVTVGTINWHSHRTLHLITSAEERETVTQFLTPYEGKRVRITVEVL